MSEGSQEAGSKFIHFLKVELKLAVLKGNGEPLCFLLQLHDYLGNQSLLSLLWGVAEDKYPLLDVANARVTDLGDQQVVRLLPELLVEVINPDIF